MKINLELEYKNYFTRNKILKLLDKKSYPYFETFIFNRIKNSKKPYTGYNYLDKDELKKYEPLIYSDLPNSKEIIDIINNNSEINETIGKKNITVSKKYFIYNNLKFKRDDRIDFLYNLIKNNKDKNKIIICLLLRYATLGISGNQCSLSYKIYEYLYDNLNIKGEGFSSPLNSKLIEKKDTIICSVFNDIDKYFKSCGQFELNTMMKPKNNNVNWILNPPFITSAVKLSLGAIIKTLSNATKKMIIILVLPYTKTKYNKNIINDYYYGYIDQEFIVSKQKKTKRKTNKQYFICNGIFSDKFENIKMYFYTNNNDLDIHEHMENISDLWCDNKSDDIKQSLFKEPIIIH